MNGFLVISICGFIAGMMNALAGGGSFVSLPALIAVGVPSVSANASSTVALFPGGVVSTWVYRKGLGPVGSVRLPPLLLVTIAGGALGAWLLLHTKSTLFDLVLPWLLLIATLALRFAASLGEWLRRRLRIGKTPTLSVQFLLGIYGGYFGGAVGIMMMAIWALLETRDLKAMHAPRCLLVCAANLTAVVIFVAAHAVAWRQTTVMLIFASVGGFAGAQIGRRAPANQVRIVTLCVTGCVTLAFFFHAYGRFLR